MHGMRVFDVESLPTHGGSLRVFVCLVDAPFEQSDRVGQQLNLERRAGFGSIETYRKFARVPVDVKVDVLNFFVEAHRAGKRVAGYGAPAKGNTLLNYCGIGKELLPFTVDRSLQKQGLLLPGSGIPILEPEALIRYRPDYVFVLPWNLRDEIVAQLAPAREWGTHFVTPIPHIEIF
jgi:hypothetical protein